MITEQIKKAALDELKSQGRMSVWQRSSVMAEALTALVEDGIIEILPSMEYAVKETPHV